MNKIFTLLFLFAFYTVSAQNLKISGKVLTNDSDEIAVGATIRILNSKMGSISDTNGEFDLAVDPGTYILGVSYLGYAKQQKEITLTDKNLIVNFELIPDIKALDEVIVMSAAKSETPILNVPASITRIESQKVDKLRLWNQRSMSTLSGNLSVVDYGGGDGNNYSIRGVSSTNFDPSITTYIDGINQFDIYSNIEFLHDVESIEILKGPQGTLFGRNALGGVINITTKQPTNDWRGKAQVSLGNFDLQRYDLSVSGPIIKDKLYFSAAGLLGEQDGFFTNTFDNSNFNATEYNGVSLSFRYDISDNWSATLSGKRYSRELVGYVPYVGTPQEALANPFELAQDAVGKSMQDMTQASFKLQYSGDHFNFKNVFSVQTSVLEYQNVDIDFTSFDVATFTRPIEGTDNTVNVLTNEFTFSNAAGAERLKWILGTYVFKQQLPINQLIRSGEAAVAFDPTAPNQTLNFTSNSNDGFAVFGQLTYPISNKVEIIGGIRYDYEERAFDTRTDFITGNDPAVTISPERSIKTDFDAFSPKLGFSWNATNNTNLYLTYSRGYRIGGTNTSLDSRFESYDPETSDNFELGAKGRLFDNRLEFALSAFYIQRNDIQLQVAEPGSNGFNFVTLNSGDGQNLGLEMDLNFILSKGLRLSYNLGLLNAEYTTLELLDAEGNPISLEDKKAIISPPSTSNLMLDYTKVIRLGSNDLVFNGNIQWTRQSEIFFDFSNTVSQEAYSLFNARVGADYKGIGLYFWVQNISDEQYIQWSAPVAPISTLGAPRTYGVTMSYEFN